MYITEILLNTFRSIGLVLPILIAVAYFTIVERKVLGETQRRKGPNVVGFLGVLQPFADGLKLFAKETTVPYNATTGIFFLAPANTFIFSLIAWASIPYCEGTEICDLHLGVLFLFAISSINVYGILFAGWASNSKYAFLGAVRSGAQMISYEVSLGLTTLSVITSSGSFNLSSIVMLQESSWFLFQLFPMFLIFYISILAETNRHPFDLPEAESELVSGYNVEYSAMTFALFFLSEYGSMLLMSAFSGILFLGGWHLFLEILPDSLGTTTNILFGAIFFILSRATLPRYRYNQLMDLGWKAFLPISLGFLIFNSDLLLSVNVLP